MTDQNETNYFSQFLFSNRDDIPKEIFSNLSCNDLLNCANVCSSWNEFINQTSIGQALLQDRIAKILEEKPDIETIMESLMNDDPLDMVLVMLRLLCYSSGGDKFNVGNEQILVLCEDTLIAFDCHCKQVQGHCINFPGT